MDQSLPSGAKERKDMPVYSGVLKYFPRAIAYIAHVSKVGNDQHNPGEPLHWAKDKSTDHLDSCVRHLMDAGKTDKDGVLHSGKAAWRALANLETELEEETSPFDELNRVIEETCTAIFNDQAEKYRKKHNRLSKLGRSICPMVIYVAGPYRNSDPSVVEYNINRADWVGRMLKKFGHHPIIPHTMTRSWDNRFTFEEIIGSELQILSRCDAIFHYGSSEGADIELAEAERLGLRVFHKLVDVPNLTGAWICTYE